MSTFSDLCDFFRDEAAVCAANAEHARRRAAGEVEPSIYTACDYDYERDSQRSTYPHDGHTEGWHI